MIYCNLYGDCDLLRGPGMDVTDPSTRHRLGEGPRAEVRGGWIFAPVALPAS
jgi:hypothetical protein